MISCLEAAEGLANQYLSGRPTVYDVEFLSARITDTLLLLGVSSSADMDYDGPGRKSVCDIEGACDGLCDKYFPGTSTLYERGRIRESIEAAIRELGGSTNAVWRI